MTFANDIEMKVLKQNFKNVHLVYLQIASRAGSQHFKCLFRVTFVPKDAYDLLRQDSTAFEYFYTQVSNTEKIKII